MTEHHLVFRVGNDYDALKIVTNYLRTLAAVRNLDWIAYAVNWQTGDPIGHGSTEQEAIDDLRKELESRVYAPLSLVAGGED